MAPTDHVPGKIQSFRSTSESSDLRWWFRVQLFLTLVGVTGIAAVFLPFTWSISPFSAAFMKDFDLWQIAWPAFLPLLITVVSLRWLFATTLSRTELTIAHSAGAVSIALVCITLFGFIRNIEWWPTDVNEWLTLIFPVVTLVFGIYVLIRSRKNLIINPFLAIFSMQVAYIANCFLCLISFFGEWQIGAYFCLITVIVYLIQIILVYLFCKPISGPDN
jgi:hypothetical protein